MAEFEDKLSSILSNQAAMSQIMALAQSLSGGEESTQSKQPPSPPPSEGNSKPQGTGTENPLSVLGDLDPRILQIGGRLLREYQNGNDKNTALLLALRPFLREERYSKVDKAIQLARLARVIRVALEAMGKTGGDEHV